MKFSVSGPSLDELYKQLATLEPFAGEPTALDVDYESRGVDADWLAHWLPRAKREIRAVWPDDGLLSKGRGKVLARSRAFNAQLARLPSVLAPLSFELAALWTPWGEDWKAAGYQPPGFSDGQLPHGWACMFKGAGHDRLVSRRWLEYGPWRWTQLADDVSVVEFYDLNADAATALAQARRGHERMGISPTGGFLQTGYAYYHKLDGVYDRATRTYKIPVAVRALPQTEMLDACALRREKRNDPDTPIERIGFVFVMGPDEAQPYLHELWLRELECWAVVDGKDVRLDQDYQPPTPPPAPW